MNATGAPLTRSMGRATCKHSIPPVGWSFAKIYKKYVIIVNNYYTEIRTVVSCFTGAHLRGFLCHNVYCGDIIEYVIKGYFDDNDVMCDPKTASLQTMLVIL